MEKDKMVEKVCEKMCAVYYDDGGTCSLDGFLCHDDNHCARRQNAKELIDELFPEGSVVLTKEELVKTLESGYVYDTTKGNKINLIEMAREIERKETKREVLKKLNGFRFVMYDEFDDGHEVASWTCDEDDVKRFAKEIGAE